MKYTKDYYAEKLNKLSKQERKSLYDIFKKQRDQHRQEQYVSGWSKKYRDLEKEVLKAEEKYFGKVSESGDIFRTEKIWSVLSDEFLYNVR